MTNAVAQSAATAATVDIPLAAPHGFSAANISPVGNGQFCVSGFVYDDAGPSESAYVLLVDTNRRQVVWRTPIPYARDHVSNTATRCLSDGSAYYVVTQEHTNSSESLNQTRVVINKISDKGALLKQQPVKTGFDEWSYFLDVQPNLVSVGGGTSATLDRGGNFSTFVAQFDANLNPTKTVKLDNGAFWTGSKARLDGDSLLVSGEFMPNKGASAGGHDAFASAKIDLGRSRYTWASYALPNDTQQATAIFTPDGATYTVGLTATDLAVSVVDRTGKAVNTFAVKKPLCGLDAATLNGQHMKVIGSACKGDAAVMVDIDLAGKTASAARQLDANVVAPQFDDQSWVAVVGTKANGKVFRRNAQ
ncbi:hypothetical protein PQQ51_30965 [Paraburkholderia xenovorans]|uniref:hypothetical protein n=1 Tax=Paraburkholderia xenovorans TaxID=36873 RepID=UPI0038B95697